ncbi:hypothetical protein J3A83DRAFT_4345205 [Scleroderma citrinum]
MGNILGKSKTQNIGEKDVIVFVVGPTGAGKSRLIGAVDKDRGTSRNAQGLAPSTKDVQAWTYTFERIPDNIVLVDTPSFHTDHDDADAESVMRKWIQSNVPAQCRRSGILYLHNLARNPEDNDQLIRRHLDTFTRTFPNGHCVPSFVYVVPTIQGLKPGATVERHFPKLQAAVNSLSANWKASMSSERFQNESSIACDAVRHLRQVIVSRAG